MDYPFNRKPGAVCVYYKNLLPLKSFDIQYLKECIIFELQIMKKICKIVTLQISPVQLNNAFKIFPELTLDKMFQNNNPFLLVVLGDFSTTLCQWY